MKAYRLLLILLLLSAVTACRYKTAPEMAGNSDSVSETDILLGGVLAEKLNGFIAMQTAHEVTQPIAMRRIQILQEQIEEMMWQKEPAISDSLMEQWNQVEQKVDLNFEHLSGMDLKKWAELNGSLLKYTGLVCFADKLEDLFYNSLSSEVLTEEAVKSVYFTRRYDRIYVNIYGNSILNFEHTTGGKVRLIQDTGYPNDGKITFRVEIENTRYMDLYIRIPEWAEMASVTAMGVKYPAYPGKYAEIARKWKNGDEVQLILGIKPEIIRNANGQIAFKYGPLFLTYEQDSTLNDQISDGDPMQYLKFVSPPGKMPTFTFSGIPEHTLVLQPFYAETEIRKRTAWLKWDSAGH